MTSLNTLLERVGQYRRARRRAHNLRAGSERRQPGASLAWLWLLAGAAATAAGAGLIALHARQLTASAAPLIVPAANTDALQAALPGAVFRVPAEPGIAVTATMGGSVLVATSMRAQAPVRVDLCRQMSDTAKGKLLALRIGYHFGDVERWVGQSVTPLGLHNVTLAGPLSADMPQVQVSGQARADFADPSGTPLQLTWNSRSPASWISDTTFGQVEQGNAAQVGLRQEGWLIWGGRHALHLQRRSSTACPQAGELLLQLLSASADQSPRALVQAFPLQGKAVTSWLQAGAYALPAVPRVALEDQALFQQLLARALVRLADNGMIEVVPRDLAAWQAGNAAVRSGELASWAEVARSETDLKLVKRLYRMADGEYVRQQIDVFNSERRLLAWRLPGNAAGAWQASVGGAAVRLAGTMPTAAARLFADLPQGWGGWSRIGQWPRAGKAQASMTLSLPQPAQGGQTLQLLLVGRLVSVDGARLLRSDPLCSGRACPARDAVQQLTLALSAGVQQIALHAEALDLGPLLMHGDQQYRHLRLVDGKLDWQPLPGAGRLASAANRPAAAAVTLLDRHGSLLWNGGAPTAVAEAAGLAPLLGLRLDHANSVAGMLGRLPAGQGAAHSARLSIDLAMQSVAAGALDCIGMRRAQWDGQHCSGAKVAPEGRRAGVVIVDLENGDLLAAAGAGAGLASKDNWSEVRDFDLANPARSPLRLPALQHDGGAHQSPGSTFKVISALGLELAAKRDPQLDALLGGMPLAAINQLAARRGFAFQTGAASYPVDARHAHITNYREQVLDRRAEDGRLGLAQALTYSLNTWFAWSGELSDRSLFGRPDGGVPDLQALEPGALDAVRPIVAMARRLGFEQPLRLDGGLLPPDYPWAPWDALQASAAHIDPIHSRHELRQMAIGLRMQVTPLQMALAAGAIGQGKVVAPRLLLELDSKAAVVPPMADIGVRLDRIRAGMKGVVDVGTAAGAFRGSRFDTIRRGLSGKTGTSPTLAATERHPDLATVWFTGYLEPGSLPDQPHRLAIAAFISHSEASGGEHAAPLVAAILARLAGQKLEQKGK